MRNDADIIVFDSDGNPVMAVEVKGEPGGTVDWATQLRRNLIVHNVVRQPKYFLLASPDRFYLWDESTRDRPDAPPTHEVDPTPFLEPYLSRAGLPREALRGSVFEMIVGSWLQTAIIAADTPHDVPANHRWIAESGLLGDIKGGRIEYPATV